MYADALQACLQERVALGWSLKDLWRPFFREVARAADRPWQLATGEDFRFTETTGPRGRALKFAALVHGQGARGGERFAAGHRTLL